MGRLYTTLLLSLLLSLLALYRVQSRPHAFIGGSPCPAIEVVPPHTAAGLDRERAEVRQSETSGYVLVVSGGESQLDLTRSGLGACKGSGSPTGRKAATVGNAMLKKCGLSLKENATAHATAHAAWGDGNILCIRNEAAEVSYDAN